MSKKEEMPQAAMADDAPTVKMEHPPSEAAETAQTSPEAGAMEDAKRAEMIAKHVEELTKDAFFTKAADTFLETIDDTMAMKGARGAWNKMPEGAQDAYLSARFVPNPVINMYPMLTKLMIDMGVLEHQGKDAEKKVIEGIENDRRMDAFISEVTKVIPEARVAAPIVEQIIKAKEAVRIWMDGRREKLIAVRRANEAKERAKQTKKADTEHIKSLREEIQES